jgi:hypothetical protein
MICSESGVSFKVSVVAGSLAALGLFVSAQAQALEPLNPLDVDIGVGWWSDSMDNGSGGAGNGGVSGVSEIWLDKNWGVRGAHYTASLDDSGIDASDHTSIDFRRRFFSLSDNSFLSLGAGWESIGLESGNSSSGLRLSASGQVGLSGSVSLYGHTSWLPGLDDVGELSNLEGQEIEAGLSFDPAPFVSVRLGYRRFKLDFDEGGSPSSSESDAFILGAGFHW